MIAVLVTILEDQLEAGADPVHVHAFDGSAAEAQALLDHLRTIPPTE